MRPPRAASSRAAPAGAFDPLQAELLQEKAANLGRLARGAERALAALREHDARGSGAPTPWDVERREHLLADACEALFLYVVQREVTGLRGTATVLDELEVSREVRVRMAPRSVVRSATRASSPERT